MDKTYIVKRNTMRMEKGTPNPLGSTQYLGTRQTNVRGPGGFEGGADVYWTEEAIRAIKFDFNTAAARVYQLRAEEEATERKENEPFNSYNVSKIVYTVEDVPLPSEPQ